MERLLLVSTLRPGAYERAAELIRRGPPFDPAAAGLTSHAVYLSTREVVFLFEGPSVESAVSTLVNDPVHGGELAHWAALTEGSPRLVLERFHWRAGSPTPD